MSISRKQLLSTAAKLVGALLDESHAKENSSGPASIQEIPMISVPGTRYAVGGFSTRNRGFYEHIAEVWDLIHHYVARPSACKPLNLLISAPPGSGKSFLVKQLLAGRDSKGPGVPYLELNVANMAKRDAIGPAWTFIRTMRENRLTPCVFFDEIDAKVDNDYLLKDLIMPMYDAAVIHDGAKLPLGPAVFIFAGSKLFEPTLKGSAENTDGKSVNFDEWRIRKEASIRTLGAANDAVPKIRDFVDRIDRCIIFPDAAIAFEGVDENVKSYEAIDLVLSMIHRHFGHVIGVEPAAAAALALTLQGGSSKRSAERLIFTSALPLDQTIFRFSDLSVEAQGMLPSAAREALERDHKNKAYRLQ